MVELEVFTNILLLTVSITLGYAALRDLRTRTISNWTSIGIFTLGVVYLIANQSPILHHLVSSAIALSLGLFLFRFGVWGGGDGKLIAATSVFFVPAELLLLLVITSLCGAFLALIFLAHAKSKNVARHEIKLPYGIAIGLGALFAYLMKEGFLGLL
ncbi:MAG: prepilin peptidase [Proteobacteria bacterium]|nr:prepilin peptidase [Pseudomonadota bacterium]